MKKSEWKISWHLKVKNAGKCVYEISDNGVRSKSDLPELETETNLPDKSNNKHELLSEAAIDKGIQLTEKLIGLIRFGFDKLFKQKN